MFEIKLRKLPHVGVIPGARGHKKQVIPVGTDVWCITYHDFLIYWAVFLTHHQAQKCMEGLQATVDGTARRKIDLNTLLAFNFKREFPKRVVRL